MAGNHLHARALQHARDALSERTHHAVLARHHSGHVEFHRPQAHTVTGCLATFMEELRGPQKRLRGNASHVQAGAAHAPFLDERHLLAHFAGVSGGFIPSRTSPDHD